MQKTRFAAYCIMSCFSRYFVCWWRNISAKARHNQDINMNQPISPANLRKAILGSIEGGKAILEIYETDFDVQYKEDESPLTIADERCNEIICKYLKDTEIPILSEEGKKMDYQERKGWDRLWVVDPLDGTKEFIKKNGEFTVNIALVEKQSPIAGVIFVPVLDELFVASATLGSFKINDAAAKVMKADQNDSDEQFFSTLQILGEQLPNVEAEGKPFTVVGSRSHMNDATKDFIAKQEQTHGKVEIISVGSSLKMCQVAEGKADMYPRFAPTMEWDTAAGHAIAKFAGAKVLQAESGIELQYNKEDLLNPWFLISR